MTITPHQTKDLGGVRDEAERFLIALINEADTPVAMCHAIRTTTERIEGVEGETVAGLIHGLLKKKILSQKAHQSGIVRGRFWGVPALGE